MKVDLHVHIHRTSHCARCDIDEMAQAAISMDSCFSKKGSGADP